MKLNSDVSGAYCPMPCTVSTFGGVPQFRSNPKGYTTLRLTYSTNRVIVKVILV